VRDQARQQAAQAEERGRDEVGCPPPDELRERGRDQPAEGLAEVVPV
jgi:hypothetical protein